MEKVFNASQAEARIREAWEREELHRSSSGQSNQKTFLIPPPGITGPLHAGHALNAVMMDVLARHSRLSGSEVLLKTGFSHSGGAIEALLRRKFADKGLNIHDLDRDELLDEVWKWKAKCEQDDNRLLQRLGVSSAWTRQPFTLDSSYSASVCAGFEALYKEGLIRRREKLVDWCPRCQQESPGREPVEVEGTLWQIKFGIPGHEGEERKYLAATTFSPEVICGVGAVAVHPSDERYRDLIGAKLKVPLTGFEVPVVPYRNADPRLGTGAFPVAGGFDHEDFAILADSGIAPRPLAGADGRLGESAGRYGGLDMTDVRERVMHDLGQEGMIQAIRSHRRKADQCLKCGSPVVRVLTQQWFFNPGEGARAIADKIRKGECSVSPERWKDAFIEILEGEGQWLISRKSWWGIPVPASFCNSCSEVRVGSAAQSACARCGSSDFRTENDVLASDFTVAFWPLAAFRWPEGGDAFKAGYPSDTIAVDGTSARSGPLRMSEVCFGLTGKLPFRSILVHATVADAAGRKMSWIADNASDPGPLIEAHGADSVRVAYSLMSGSDGFARLSNGSLALGRSLVDKIWNVSRHAIRNMSRFGYKSPDSRVLAVEDHWILGEFASLMDSWKQDMGAGRVSRAAERLCRFVAVPLSKCYVEALRLRSSDAGPEAFAGHSLLVEMLRRLLPMIHPFAPFVCTEIWGLFAGLPACSELFSTPVDRAPLTPIPLTPSANAAAVMKVLMDIVKAVRSVRTRNGIHASVRLKVIVNAHDPAAMVKLLGRELFVKNMAGCSEVEVTHGDLEVPGFAVAPAGPCSVCVQIPSGGATPDSNRLASELRKAEGRFHTVLRKLESLDFISSAPEDLVNRLREQKRNLFKQIASMSAFSALPAGKVPRARGVENRR